MEEEEERWGGEGAPTIGAAYVEKAGSASYKSPVFFRIAHAKSATVGFVAFLFALAGCERDGEDDSGAEQAERAAAEQGEEAPDPAEAEPVPGVDVGDLPSHQQGQFHQLVDDLSSPCGEAHSLRTSVTEDDECERAVFAARYVAQLVEDGATELDVRQLYDERYREDFSEEEFSPEDVPRKGPSDARVEIVEFIDYGCPHCKTFGAVIDRAQQAWPNDVAVYYRFFPLDGNPTGEEAARAAVAAERQGEFEAMHEALFANQNRHDEDSVREYAEQIGLDMETFEEDYEAAGELVERDRSRGREAGVRATPTVFINGREYTDPDRFEYVKLWIEEELALRN